MPTCAGWSSTSSSPPCCFSRATTRRPSRARSCPSRVTSSVELVGRRALVTGAGRRVGQAIAVGLARAGCDVAVHYRGSAAGAGETGERIRAAGRRAELAPDSTVDAVAPGAVLPPDAWDDKARQRLARTTPLQRLGSPDDVVQAVRYLLEGGDYVTGTTLVVDGGRLIR